MELTREQLSGILKINIEQAIAVFVEKHNKTHKSLYISGELIESEGLNYRDVKDSKYVRLEFRLSVNGVSKLIYGKTMGYTADDQHDMYQLVLYKDILVHFVGFGLLFHLAQLIDDKATESDGLQPAVIAGNEQKAETT